MAIEEVNPITGIKNVTLLDENFVKNLFNLYTVPGVSGTTEGLLDSLQKFYETYLNDPRNLFSGLNVSGDSGDVYRIRYDATDTEGYLVDKIKAASGSGVTITVDGGSNKVMNFSVNIQESDSTSIYSLLKDEKTLKKLVAGSGMTINQTDDEITFTASEAGESPRKLYNPSATPIPSGTPLHLTHTQVVLGVEYPVFQYAKADIFENCQGSIVFADGEIAGESIGLFAYEKSNLDCDLSYLNIVNGRQLWLSTETAGLYTNIRPSDEFALSLGGMLLDQTAMWAKITTTTYDKTNDAFIGSALVPFNFLVESNGTTVTGTLTNAENILDDLPLVLPDFYTFDTTTAPATVTLTTGNDEEQQTNYIYIPEDTKLLTSSLIGFPTNQNHCKIAIIEAQTAVTVQTEGGARRNHNLNDPINKVNGNGHMLHVAERIRQLNAEHDNGTEGTLTGTPTNAYLQITGGEVWQMHKQSFASMSMPTDFGLVVNDFTTPYNKVTNLNTISTYSDGSNWNNDWSNIVVWGVANKTGEPNYLMINLPKDGYNNEDNAIADRNNYTNYNIPKKFKGVAFLIARFTVRISGGTVTYNSGSGYTDLRGTIPNNIAGGGSGGGVTSLLSLDDVSPSSFTGQAGKSLTVASSETTTEFVEFLKIDGSNASQDIDIGTYSIKGNDAIFDSMRLTNPNTPLSLGVTYVRQPRMFNLRSDAGAIIEFERDTEDFGCRQVLGANFYDFYTGATGSMSQRLRLGLTSSYFYNDLYIVGKLTNVSSIVSTGTIKANTNEIVLTENIVDDLGMNGFDIEDAGSGTFTGNITLDSSSGRLVARNTANNALVVYGHNTGSIGENNYGFYSTIMAKNILQLNATNGDIEVARSGSFDGEVSRQGFFSCGINTQSIDNTSIKWDVPATRKDSGFYEHSDTVNNERIKVLKSGWYKVSYDVGGGFSRSDSGDAYYSLQAYIEKSVNNGSSWINTNIELTIDSNIGDAQSASSFNGHRTTQLLLNANDIIRIKISEGSTNTTNEYLYNRRTEINIEKVT